MLRKHKCWKIVYTSTGEFKGTIDKYIIVFAFMLSSFHLL